MTYDLQLFDAAAGSLWFETGFKTGPLQTGLGVLTGNLMTSAVGSLKNLAGAAINVGASFEAGMSEVQAISQIDTATAAGAAAMDQLTAKAKEMGATTKFSATEASEAMKYMAMAGWKTEDMLAGIDGIMNLAAASGESLGTVSDIVTDDLTAFGYSAKDASHFADVLAAASSNANTNVSLMGETFKYVGPVAGSLNYSIEDMAIATGLMANASIKGSMAGTAMRTMLTNLVKPSDQTAAAMEKLHISMTDENGNMKSMQDLLINLRTSFSGLSEAEKAQYAATIAGQRGMSGLLAIVNASDEDFNKLTTAIYSSDGAATTMADTMQNNLTGKVTILKSALEGLGISVFEKFSPTLTSSVEGVTNAINSINDDVQNGELGKSLDRLADSMGDFLDRAIELGMSALPTIVDAITWILDHSEELISAFLAFEIARMVYRGVDAITALSGGISGLLTLLTANPFALLIASVVGLIAYVAIYTKMAEAAKKATDGMTDSEVAAYEAAQDAIHATQDLIKEIDDTLQAYDNQAEVAHDLVAEFESLEGLDDAASMERRKQIIAQLNAMYPELNARVDEEGRLINTTTEAIDDYIDAQTRRLKAAAAEDMLADVAKQQVENEIALKNEVKARGEAQRRYNRALGEAVNLQAEYDKYAQSGLTPDHLIDPLGEAYANVQEQERILNEHKNTIAELTQVQGDLNEKWSDLQGIIHETTPAIGSVTDAEEQATQSAEDFARSLVTVTEEMADAFTDVYESAQKNILGAADIFKKADEETKASLNDMLAGLQANADAYASYADNLATLLSFAQENTNAQGLVSELVNGGMDNAGRIQALVDAINAGNEQVNTVIDAFNEAEAAREEATLALTEATYQANNGFDTTEYEAVATTVLGEKVESITKPVTEATAEAQSAVDDATAAMQSSAETAATDTSDAVTTATDEITTAVNDAAEAVPETVQTAVDATQQAVVDGHDPIVTAAQANATDAMTAIETEVADAYDLGLQTGQDYAKGLRDSAAEVEAAASAVMKRVDAIMGDANASSGTSSSGQSAESVAERMISRAASLFSSLPIGGIGGAGSQRTPITVVSELDGREIARGTSWYMGEQLAWEAR